MMMLSVTMCVVFQKERITVFSMAESQAKIAQKTWELSNNIMEVSAGDEIYKYDRQQQQSLLAAKPWDKDPHFFKDIKISALALLKMVMHARSGGNLEIMGLLLGKVRSRLHMNAFNK